MVYDKATHSTHSPPGCEIRAPLFGDVYPVENFSPQKLKGGKYFIDLTDALVTQKHYTRNTNLRGAGYDFRRAPSKYRELQ
ncbi:hypothetical protein LSTR_LSTR002866 [Laodelphax striatellus]|uniref:Uncharacterized protein n=1 Tax=Laodelphax striatellus TaxID=195883 RepID=A0A482XSZ3_LAOST|nr:hypothetical protein LSTR_LSTR002866 [Laodelphax striatellus]